ncbi:hypothetical protein HAHE_35900 [Haloferula helveola]|uniref:PEP-CTERM protein-sorting domain-containing protein n=1 Tax=Haloferula helveola TaxID=490095 RepID=A0ABM7RIA5_9BACT|nr:hypothetical protein HAHE_35900 [Haloferula helveola]
MLLAASVAMSGLAAATPEVEPEAVIQAIPEPATAFLGVLGLCLILFRRFRS